MQKATGLSSKHSPALLITAVSAVAAVLLSIIYNFYIAQELIYSFNGYYPSYFYQRLPENSFLNWVQGLSFITCNCGFFLTSLSDPLYLEIIGFAFVIFLLFAVTAQSRAPGNKKLRLLIFIGIFAAIALCCSAMTTRHPAIMTIYVIFGIYFQPFFAVIFALFATAICALNRKNILYKTGVVVLITAIVCRSLFLTGFITEPEYPNAIMNLHNNSTAETIKLLNNPQRQMQQVLPLSSWNLVGFFRNRTDIFPLEKNIYSPEKIK